MSKWQQGRRRTSVNSERDLTIPPPRIELLRSTDEAQLGRNEEEQPMKRLAAEFPETTSSSFNAEGYGEVLTQIRELELALLALDDESRAWALNDLVKATTVLVSLQKILT